MKSSQQRYKNYHDLKFLNVPLWLTAEQYMYLDQPAMTNSATERLETESYNKLMPPKTGLFKVIKVQPTTINIYENGSRNTVSIDRATLVPSVKFAERQHVYTPGELGDD